MNTFLEFQKIGFSRSYQLIEQMKSMPLERRILQRGYKEQKVARLTSTQMLSKNPNMIDSDGPYWAFPYLKEDFGNKHRAARSKNWWFKKPFHVQPGPLRLKKVA